MLRRAFLRAVGAAAVSAVVGIRPFLVEPRVPLSAMDLDAIVKATEPMMGAYIDYLFAPNPFMVYLKKHAGERVRRA